MIGMQNGTRNGMVRNIQSEKCTDGNGAVDLSEQQCNGNATERVDHGTSAIKGNNVSSGITLERSQLSPDSHWNH